MSLQEPTTHSQSITSVLTPFPAFNNFQFLILSNGTLSVGELVSSIPGAIKGEKTALTITAQRVTTFQFDPPHLRTKYTLNDVLINLPALTELVRIEEAGFNYGTTEVGWGIQLLKAGAVAFSELIPITPTKPVESEAAGKKSVEREWPPVIRQLQLVQPFSVSKAMPIEIRVFTFIHIQGEIAKTKIAFLEQGGGLVRKEPFPTIDVTILYDQEYQGRKSG